MYLANTLKFFLCLTQCIRSWDTEKRSYGERKKELRWLCNLVCTPMKRHHWTKTLARDPFFMDKGNAALQKAMAHGGNMKYLWWRANRLSWKKLAGIYVETPSTSSYKGRFLFGLEFEVWDCRSALATEFFHTSSPHILQVRLIHSDVHISLL